MKCNDCKNKSICKFVENTQQIEESMKEIKILKCSPIKIKLECYKYIKSDLVDGGGIFNKTKTVGVYFGGLHG